jgi:hypothetical protein
MKVAGVEYYVNWRAFTKGKSLFFPCLDSKAAWREDVRPVVRRLKLNVVHKSVVDPKSGIRGLRIWRI